MHASIAIAIVIAFAEYLVVSEKHKLPSSIGGNSNSNSNMRNMSALREPVGDFYVHLIRGDSRESVDRDLTCSNALLKGKGKPTVISFYDGGWGGCRPCAAQMRHWASTIPNVQFLEVCVESEAVALHFHRTFGFGENHHQYSSKPSENNNSNNNDDDEEEGLPPVINGWIPSRSYMPVGYGQLGCSGFVISDANGKFISRKTSAYLQFGEEAFRHVESILADLLVETANEQRKQGLIVVAPSAASIERIAPQISPKQESDRKKQKKSETDNSSSQSRNTSTGSPTSVLVVEAPSSVGVESMDEEHQICTDSFNRALKDPTFETLLEVFELLKAHFLHEEELIAKYAITPEQAASPFSALNSHRKDHFRILSIAAVELQRITNLHNAGAGGCATVDGQKVWRRPPAAVTLPPPETPIDRRVLESLVKAFHVHAETFDSLYEDKVPADAH